MVKIKVNVKTKNDSIPSGTTKRKMPIVVDPKLHPHPRYHDTNVGDIKNFKEIIKHDIINIEEDGFHAIYDDWDIKYEFVTGEMKYPNYNEVISQFRPGFAEKVLIDPLNIELIADALNARRGIRFHFPKDDSKGIKITFYDKELSLSEALLMPKLDY